MDSSGFRPSSNLVDRRGEGQGHNALLFAAIARRIDDPTTPEHEKEELLAHLQKLMPYEFHPQAGLQGGDTTHASLGQGQRHIGQAQTAPETPLGFGILGEFSDMVQRPQRPLLDW
jgi:hypothetical protein